MDYNAFVTRYGSTESTWEKKTLDLLCHSGSRSHPRQAPLCDLTVDGCVHVASVTLQKHREAGEGTSDLLHQCFFSRL